MSDFKAKMHQIQFPLELCSRPHLQHSLRLLVVFKGSTSKVSEGKGREGKGEGTGDVRAREVEGERDP